MKKTILFVSFLALCFSCNFDTKDNAIDLEKMATSTCQCLKSSGLDSINRRLEHVIENDSSEVNTSEMLIASQNCYNQFTECMKSLEKKYGKIQDSVQEEKLEKILQKNCPEAYEIITEEMH